jgi:hypothetical protein
MTTTLTDIDVVPTLELIWHDEMRAHSTPLLGTTTSATPGSTPSTTVAIIRASLTEVHYRVIEVR